jgi:hypothetical protein
MRKVFPNAKAEKRIGIDLNPSTANIAATS